MVAIWLFVGGGGRGGEEKTNKVVLKINWGVL